MSNVTRAFSFHYLVLGLFLIGWTGVSQHASDRLRSVTIGSFISTWNCAKGVKEYLADRPLKNKKTDTIEPSLLQLENQKLKTQIEWAKEWISHEAKIQQRAFPLEIHRKALPAHVVYRDPSSWSNSLWIGVGKEDNRMTRERIIARNSPVVVGNSLIGVVDYVGKRQSRVRLITDSNVTPAVRVLRERQPKEILYLIDILFEKVKENDIFFEFAHQLQNIKDKLIISTEEVYLAKGELRGNGAPFWRSRHPVLKGIGFNYDYADTEGPARDLRSGCPLVGSEEPLPLIVKGDHLVTSGLDGVFPRGLSVAIATEVFPLKEGSFSYEIEATPTALGINDLKVVFVLPPLSDE